MLKLLTHSGYHHREGLQMINTGNLVGGRTGGYPGHSNNDEIEVTCRVKDQDGHSCMYNGVFIFKGAPVLGVELDHEALFIMEYGHPEGDISLIGFQGRVSALDAWITTADGSVVVLKAVFQDSLKVEEGDLIPVTGPDLRFTL